VICSCLELAACSDKWLEGGGEICFCESTTVYSYGFLSALIVVRDNVMYACHISFISYTTSRAIHLLLTLPIGGY
jgi:hypothetical protein